MNSGIRTIVGFIEAALLLFLRRIAVAVIVFFVCLVLVPLSFLGRGTQVFLSFYRLPRRALSEKVAQVPQGQVSGRQRRDTPSETYLNVVWRRDATSVNV